MARIKTVVEVLVPVYNEAGEQLDTDNKPMDPSGKKDQKPQMKEERYYLLHWGLQTDYVYDEKGYPIPYSSTVGVCQHIQTGVVSMIVPTALRVIGREVADG